MKIQYMTFLTKPMKYCTKLIVTWDVVMQVKKAAHTVNKDDCEKIAACVAYYIFFMGVANNWFEY